jgi:hypothetical protein
VTANDVTVIAEPETAEPETAEPETAEPETAEPETAEPETVEPETVEQIGAVLRALMTGHPEFRFGHDLVGWHGRRWIAERAHGVTPGLHTVITEHLSELRAALRQDRERVARAGTHSAQSASAVLSGRGTAGRTVAK